MRSRIPLFDTTNVLGREVLPEIERVIDSGWLTLGSETEEFEREFADAHHVEHGVALNSCTSALYASLRALGIGPGDTVVVPAITFSATANVVRLLGADVVLCDVNENGNVDPAVLARLLDDEDADAVIPVHLYGLPCDVDEIVAIADEHDVAVVEDCAHAPGAEIDGRPVGSFGDAGCFSFYATKNMTTGEGGMMTTDDPDLAERVRKLRNHHQTKTPEEKRENWGYDVDGLGFNFRMSELEAAIGRSQLRRLDDMNESRRARGRRYVEALAGIDGIDWVGNTDGKTHAFHLFVVRVEDEYPLSRDELYDALDQRGITTSVHYPSISSLSYYSDVAGRSAAAESFAERILSLPLYPDMDEETQDTVVRAIADHAQA